MVVHPVFGTPNIPELREDLKVKKEHEVEKRGGDSVSISDTSKQILQTRSYAKELAVELNKQSTVVREEKVALARARINNNFYQEQEVINDVVEHLFMLLSGA